MRRLITSIFLLLVISACSSSKLIPKHELEQKNYQEVIGDIDNDKFKLDNYAMYPNGLQGIYEHVAKTTRYPSNAVKNNIEGKVVVQFIVEKSGQVKVAKVNKKISPELDKEALRVILSLERFYPGFKDGKPVRILYRQPINFSLK